MRRIPIPAAAMTLPRVARLALAACLLGLLAPGVASGQQPRVVMPRHDFGLGLAGAYLGGDDHGFALNLEGSYTYGFVTVALDVKVARDDGRILSGPQLELTAWYFVNAGAGAGYLFGEQRGPVVHLFLGVPWGGSWLPDAMAPFSTLYVEPYYRPSFFFPGGGVRLLHEVGLMVKINTYEL